MPPCSVPLLTANSQYSTEAMFVVCISVIFNNQPFHAIAISLAAMGQAMVNLFTDGTYKIKASNFPLPRTEGK